MIWVFVQSLLDLSKVYFPVKVTNTYMNLNIAIFESMTEIIDHVGACKMLLQSSNRILRSVLLDTKFPGSVRLISFCLHRTGKT